MAADTNTGATAQRRRVLEQVAGSTSSLLFIAIVVMANYLAFRHYERFDWTTQGMFTLSPKSNQILGALTQPTDIYLFMSQGESNFEDTDELLKRYQAASEQVKIHYVDPERELAEYQILAQRFGVMTGVTQLGEARADVAAVVSIGDKNWHVSRDDLVGFSMGAPGEDEEEMNVKAEQALTGAIVQATSGRATKACVTKGHAEWTLEEGGSRSLAPLKMHLRHDNIDWTEIETLGKKSVPEDCDAVFVFGPALAYSEPEAEMLAEYLRKGGNLLLALDPVIEQDVIKPTGFEAMANGFGIRIDRSLVIEMNPERLLSPNAVEFLATEFGDHPTTRALVGNARVLVTMARSVNPTGSTDNTEILMRASDKAFGETDVSQVMGEQEPSRSAEDIPGPVSLAVAVRVNVDPGEMRERPGGRLIVLGDSDLVQAPALEAPELANFHVVSAWIGWLTEREALIEIPPKKVTIGRIVFTQEDLWALFFRVAVLLPGAALLFGVGMWMNRRA